jgi:tetratricopeptide (TPR) repeat protein
LDNGTRVQSQAQSAKARSLFCLALGLVTLVLYLPAVRYDFLAFDDQEYVTENPHVRAGLTLKGLVWAFGFHASNWHPLTWVSHMLDCQIYGLNPAGHHLTNVLLHAANTVLLFLVLSWMTGGLWRSAIVAALFGWHPLHVESVAWVAERKDVLSGFFFMLTLLAYVRYVEKSETRNPKSEASQKSEFWKRSVFYALALLFFALGLMSKPMVVTLPFVLLLSDFWPLRRIQFPIADYRTIFDLLREKVPFLALTTIACILTVIAQAQAHSVASTAGLHMLSRITHALVAYLHYIGVIFWPRHLAIYYPYKLSVPPMEVLGSGLVLGIISMVALRFARKYPSLLVGWLWFLGMLVPVIGLVQVGEQAWADRYTYLPSFGLFVAVVWGIWELFQSQSSECSAVLDRASGDAVRTPHPTFAEMVGRGVLTAPGILMIGMAVTLVILASLQLRYWTNTRTLFEHTANVTRNNYMAVTLLGSLDAKEGKLVEAIERYKTALSWKSDYPEAHFFLGNAFDRQGKLDEAISEYKKALGFKPIQEETHILLGVALAKQKRYDEAVSHYRVALELNPESAVAHNNLARVLHTQGRFDEAIEHYSAALRLDPGLAEAHNNVGILLLAQGKLIHGVTELREAVRLSPDNRESAYNLATGLNQQGEWSEAAELLMKLVSRAPDDPNAHYQLGVSLSHLQKTREAMSHFASALLIRQDFPDALDGLAWILATAPAAEYRNGIQAVGMAERACELTAQKDAAKLKTLAAAYAEVGNFAKAIAAATNAVQTAFAGGRTNLAQECQTMLANFTAARPWRQ